MPDHVRRRRTFAEARRVHRRASVHLAEIDAELEAVIARRRRCLGELDSARAQLCRRWGNRKLRRPPMAAEAPLPPPVVDAEPLWGVDLRTVSLRVLRHHGAQRLRDLHGLLHCYGFVIDSQRPVQRLADALAYECAHGRARRLERGVYEAVGDGHVLFPADPWSPELDDPLPWRQPGTAGTPPLIDPAVADDPEHWSTGTWPDPPEPTDTEGATPTPAPSPEGPTLPSGELSGDSSTNRPPEPPEREREPERERGWEGEAGRGEGPAEEPP